MTTEQLGNEITRLAAHINAATARWLELVAEFDRREGWADWGVSSCAHWISWRCAMAPGPAREHVRVARKLEQLPLTQAAFARGELSYSKVRALTRVENVQDEPKLVELAENATAAQLERIVQAYRGVVRAEDAGRAHEERCVSLTQDPDGTWCLRGRLPAEDGAVLARALDAARDGLRERERDRAAAQAEGVPAGTPDNGYAARNSDAMVLLADTLLANGPRDRSSGDRYQVVVHVDQRALVAAAGAGPDGPAHSGQCDVEDGGPLAPETARRLACDSSLVTLVERDGRPMGGGRKTRSVPPAMARALRRRDPCCRFPGCTRRRGLDNHHIHHWAHGGETEPGNLVRLCRHHHRLLHEGGFHLERAGRAGLVFRTPGGQRLPGVPRARRGHAAAIERSGPAVTSRTCVAGPGERFDLGTAVDIVLDAGPLDASPPGARPPPAD